MNTDKNALIAQIAEAMGITSREEKIKLVRYLIEKWNLNLRINQVQKPKTPNGFEVINMPGNQLPCAKYQGSVIGFVFCLNGKHFIFSHKNAENQITMNYAKENLKKGVYGKVDDNPWVIPTIEMFQEVNRHLTQFNLTMEALAKYGADKIIKKTYLDASMKNYNQVGILRLAMWAPWLD